MNNLSERGLFILLGTFLAGIVVFALVTGGFM
jgi:hypothetical protein